MKTVFFVVVFCKWSEMRIEHRGSSSSSDWRTAATAGSFTHEPGKRSAEGCSSAAPPPIKHGSSSCSSSQSRGDVAAPRTPVTRAIIQMCRSVALCADKEAECGSLLSEQEPPFPRRCPSLPPPAQTLVCYWSRAVQSRVAFAEGHG